MGCRKGWGHLRPQGRTAVVQCVHLAKWIILMASSPLFLSLVFLLLLHTTCSIILNTSNDLESSLNCLVQSFPTSFSYILEHMKIKTFVWHNVGRLHVAGDPGHHRPHLAASRAEVIKTLAARVTHLQTVHGEALPKPNVQCSRLAISCLWPKQFSKFLCITPHSILAICDLLYTILYLNPAFLNKNPALGNLPVFHFETFQLLQEAFSDSLHCIAPLVNPWSTASDLALAYGLTCPVPFAYIVSPHTRQYSAWADWAQTQYPFPCYSQREIVGINIKSLSSPKSTGTQLAGQHALFMQLVSQGPYLQTLQVDSPGQVGEVLHHAGATNDSKESGEK